MNARAEFDHDPRAPSATVVVPLVHAVARDDAGRVFRVRRMDTGGCPAAGSTWAGPGVPRGDHRETSDARWWAVPDVDELAIQPAVRRRLRDARTAQVHLD